MPEVLNLFQVSNQNQLNLPYRLMTIGNIPKGQNYHANLQTVRRYVNQTYGTPAVLFKQNGQQYLAVGPNPKKVGKLPEQLSVVGLQGINVDLKLLEGINTISLKNLADTNVLNLVESFLSFELRSAFRISSDLWNGASPYIYYKNQAIDLPSAADSHVCVYQGFRHRVRIIDCNIYIAVDITHVYIDNRTLAERTIDTEWRHLVGRHFLYEFGPQRYFIRFQEKCNFSIENAKFEYPPGSEETTSVYDYTLKEWGNHAVAKTIKKDDSAIVYNNLGQAGQQRYGAVSLARLRYNTADPEIGKLHSKAILSPSSRFGLQKSYVNEYLDRAIKLDDKPVRISQRAIAISPKQFPIPSFKFGHNQILRPNSSSNGNGRNEVRELFQKRKKWLENEHIGPFQTLAPSINQFILAPFSVASDEELLTKLQEDITKAISHISHEPYEPEVLVWDDKSTTTFSRVKQEMAKFKEQMQSVGGMGTALVILPDQSPIKEQGKLRRLIKAELWPIKTKCIQISQFSSHLTKTSKGYEITSKVYWSSLYFSALKLLVVSGAKPWVLADPLNYDLYIGVDVLNDYAGFTFLGMGGELLQFIPYYSGSGEKLSAKQVVEVLLGKDGLPQFLERLKNKLGRLPENMIVHRDGRSYDSEIEGYEHCLQKLKEDSLLATNAALGVVDIHKNNSESLRMYQIQGQVTNPMIGRYHTFNSKWGLVATTGVPILTQGTASPLVARIEYGDFNIEKILQDIFNLSMLAWTKPDGIQSDPITIKLIDDWLEAVASESVTDNGSNEGLLDESEAEAS